MQKLTLAIVGRQAGDCTLPFVGFVIVIGLAQLERVELAIILLQVLPFCFILSTILQIEIQLVRTGAVEIFIITLPLLGHADLQGFERILNRRAEQLVCIIILRINPKIRVTNNIIGIGFLYTIVQLLIVLIVPRQVRPGMGLGGYFGILVQRYRSAQILPIDQTGRTPAAVLQLQRDALRAGDGCKAVVTDPALLRIHADGLHGVGDLCPDLIDIRRSVQAVEGVGRCDRNGVVVPTGAAGFRGRSGIIGRTGRLGRIEQAVGIGRFVGPPIIIRIRFLHAVVQQRGGIIDGISCRPGLVDEQILPDSLPAILCGQGL